MASPTAPGGVSDLRDRVEAAAQDESLDATDRYRMLASLRDELIDVLGAVDTYMATLNKLREAQAGEVTASIQQAREIATLRVTLVEQGIATADELDEAGFLSHTDLDALEEEGLLLEAVGRLGGKWAELLHPRGRGGKFIDKTELQVGPFDPNALDSVKADMETAREIGLTAREMGLDPEQAGRLKNVIAVANEQAKQPWRKLSGPQVSKRYTPPFDADVAKLTGWKDTQDYLVKMGLPDTDLSPTSGAPYMKQANVDFYRSLAQATKDAIARNPEVVAGSTKLVGLRFFKGTEHSVRSLKEAGIFKGVWAMTAPKDAVLTGDGNSEDENGHVIPGPMLISINPWDDSFAEPENTSDITSAATGSTYGRLTHELGHAVAASNGIGTIETIHLLDRYGFNVGDAAQVSLYAASNPPEALAEVYTTLHTPHGMDDLAPDIAQNVRDLQKGVNGQYGRTIL